MGFAAPASALTPQQAIKNHLDDFANLHNPSGFASAGGLSVVVISGGQPYYGHYGVTFPSTGPGPTGAQVCGANGAPPPAPKAVDENTAFWG